LGIVASLLKGLDYEEALILSVMLAAFLPCRSCFYRKSSLIGDRFSVGWIAAIVLAILSSVWIGFFSYKHVEYSHDLWWHFSLLGDAPRFLRASVGVFGLGLVVAVARLLRPAQPEPAAPSADELTVVERIVAASQSTTSSLALLGDKTFLFNDSRSAFIMYGIEGRSWVAMGDPVGPVSEWRELAWRFRELSVRHGGWTVFYQVRPQYLPLYLDLGLTLQKLGEEARVDLRTFSIDSQKKTTRHSYRKVLQEGAVFEVVPATDVRRLVPELKVISDAWLEEKNTREKRFSLGSFNPEYLARGPAALIRQNGRIIAFANMLLGANKEELSIDLMRFVSDSPSGTMDFLFLSLMNWGKDQGYGWFNLGMAPLSGLENRPLAPLWIRVGAMVFKHGETFYNFQGLRAYKEKFQPVWEPRYLASPGGLALPRILANVSSLVSGGMKGVLVK
jgi:phosphatidylglycerol lysyltransferase